ncbi:hypothetical protein B5V01_21885 [Mesorhizobium erdmanii]|uniref:Uncharacterized protein n=3 Tax=Phyllobacteriaceae TaxID=69277 RepID=A0A3M9X3W1_9HYPH|nr:hypothetical protein DNR46_26500 [Mesorhizobium japonicum]RXT42554.1 hypothetical protein B5V01_21885 [Mesorhizobium erdmanii]
MLAWVALRQFLTADLLRELLQILVEEVSGGEVELRDLFDERLVSSTPGFESWVLRSKPAEGRLAQQLQRVLQGIVWQSDDNGYPPTEGATPEQLQRCLVLFQALELGTRDFGFVDREYSDLSSDDALMAMFELMTAGAKCLAEQTDWLELLPAALKRLETTEELLALVILKHLGDLCADADAWQAAEGFYLHCRRVLAQEAFPEWGAVVGHLRDLTDQSIAAAARVASGAEAAVISLRQTLIPASLDDRPLLVLNAPFDLLSATLNSEILVLSYTDERTTLVRPPLNGASHHLDANVYNHSGGRFSDAVRRCWAVLRRQMALGLSTESRDTMSVFARVLLNMLEHQDKAKSYHGDFALAVRLFIQAADRSSASDYKWSDKLLQFVDASIVAMVIKACDAHPGSALDRQQAAIAIFEQWTAMLPAERRHLAKDMLEVITRLARTGQSSGFTNRDVALKAFDSLLLLARSRPDICRENIGSIHGAIVARLSPRSVWNAAAKSIELATNLLGILSAAQLREIVHDVLAYLWAIGPEKQFMPIVKPALELLVAEQVVALANADADLGRGIVNAVVAFSDEGRSGNAGLMYYLERFNGDLFQAKSVSELGAGIVSQLIDAVQKTNSSASANEIRALLSVPAMSGEAGVVAALEALKDLLATVGHTRPSPSFPYAFAPILMFVHRRTELEKVMEPALLEEYRNAILEQVYSVWSYVLARPSLLAPWAIPAPTGPNTVVVHNWTYASTKLADDANDEERMLAFLSSLDANFDLRNAIDLALATGARSDRAEAELNGDIGQETDEAFYAGLGRRLVRVLTTDADRGQALCAPLLEQCLKRGPEGLDAGVFTEAHRLGLAKTANPKLVQDYLRRLNNDVSLRMGLWPLASGLA